MNLVTLKIYREPHVMAIERGVLESEGIVTYALHEVLSRYATMTGGVKLQVAESDVDKAVGIMLERGFMQVDEAAEPSVEEKLSSLISRSGSRKVNRFVIGAIFVLALIIYLIFRLFNLS